MDPHLDAWLRARIRNPHVLDRVLTANAGWKDGSGEMLRGWHRKPCSLRRWYPFRVSRGDVIRTYGRTAWDAMPPGLIHKEGRRMAISANAAAMLKGLPPKRHGVLRLLLALQYPGRRFAGDPRGVTVRASPPGAWDALYAP